MKEGLLVTGFLGGNSNATTGDFSLGVQGFEIVNGKVAGPFGEMLAQASVSEEETLIVECDPRHTEEVRRNWPFLRDRRIDAYGDILKRYLD